MVEIEFALIGAASGAIIAGIAVATFLRARQTARESVSDRITAAHTEAERAQREAAAAKASVDEAHRRFDELMNHVSDYRADMAAKVAVVKTLVETNTTNLTAAENRLISAFDNLREELRCLGQRIDRLLDPRTGQ